MTISSLFLNPVYIITNAKIQFGFEGTLRRIFFSWYPERSHTEFYHHFKSFHTYFWHPLNTFKVPNTKTSHRYFNTTPVYISHTPSRVKTHHSIFSFHQVYQNGNRMNTIENSAWNQLLNITARLQWYGEFLTVYDYERIAILMKCWCQYWYFSNPTKGVIENVQICAWTVKIVFLRTWSE